MSSVSLIDGHIDGEDKKPLTDNSKEVKEKVVILSLQPKWCELVASGRKTVEVRKSKPKLELPFKVFIYQTKQSWVYNVYNEIADWQRKIIGEFVCDEIYNIGYSPYNHGEFISDTDNLYEKSCLDIEKMFDYLSKGYGYGWHISNLKIYDEPKELGEFKKVNRNCGYSDLGFAIPECNSCREKQCFIQRAPQSWCYAIKLPK